MLELDRWFFVQLFNFLALIVILNYLLYKPLLRLFKERERRITGSLDSAKGMDGEKESLLQQIEKKLSEARNSAKKLFEELRKEGLAIQKESIETAKNGAEEITRKAKEDLEAETKKASESLKKDIEIFSKKIVKKMVGV